mmetsp:Transcript_36176/g.108326  ORF Transcript_36176/g.108326 Transcript_36176/m.108326 type:complete len:201 (+) Transcript_36176:781-1383(+)
MLGTSYTYNKGTDFQHSPQQRARSSGRPRFGNSILSVVAFPPATGILRSRPTEQIGGRRNPAGKQQTTVWRPRREAHNLTSIIFQKALGASRNCRRDIPPNSQQGTTTTTTTRVRPTTRLRRVSHLPAGLPLPRRPKGRRGAPPAAAVPPPQRGDARGGTAGPVRLRRGVRKRRRVRRSRGRRDHCGVPPLGRGPPGLRG